MFDSFNYRTMGQDALSAVERKRHRDRRAQQQLREKRNSHIQQLEEQVAYCKENHGGGSIVSLSHRVRDLELENSMLRERADKMSHLANSVRQTLVQMQNLVGGSSAGILAPVDCNEAYQAAPSLDSASQKSRTSHLQVSGNNSRGGSHQDIVSQWTINRLSDTVQYPVSEDMDASRSGSGSSFSPPRPTSHPLPNPSTDDNDTDSGSCIDLPFVQDPHNVKPDKLPSSSLSSEVERRHILLTGNLKPSNTAIVSKNPGPPWYLVPNSDWNNPLVKELAPMNCLLESIALAPAVPNPIDILFGSRQNLLANEIHKLMRKLRVAEPERLANGWLIYVFIKWRAFPSEASFDLVPTFLRPLAEQIYEEHLSLFDSIYWPTLRLNLIKNSKDDPFYDPLDFASAISCCAKLRWPWGKEILVPTEQGNLQIAPEFYKTFTQLDCWGLTSDFIKRYLPLLKGLDIDHVLYTI